MNMVDSTVYLTMTYDFVPGQPDGWDNVKPIWFDVNQCGTSEVDAPQEDGHFVLTSKPWKPNFEGELIGVGSHVHDGGDHVEILADDQVACNSVATYGGDPAFISPRESSDDRLLPMEYANSDI